MSTQPEALLLAEAMSFAFPGNPGIDKAAAELRRQFGEIESMRAERVHTERRLAKAEAQRDALLEALKEIVAATDSDEWNPVSTVKARAAIKAVEEGK